MLIFFIYSILGAFLFGKVSEGNVIDDYTNFSNFGKAMVTLLRVSTGEDWNKIMYDLIDDGCQPAYAVLLYFLSFIVICTFVMLNLFILVILNQFDQYYLTEDSPVTIFKTHLVIFQKGWENFKTHFEGTKIHESQLIDFFKQLEPPLGFENETKKGMFKTILKMQLRW